MGLRSFLPAFLVSTAVLAVDSSFVVGQSGPFSSAVLEDVGFGGEFKVGKWSPIRVSVTTKAACRARLVIDAPDAYGNRLIQPGEFVELPDAGTHSLQGVFRTGRLQSRIVARVEVGSDSAVESYDVTLPESGGIRWTITALTHAPRVILVVGESAAIATLSSEEGIVVVQQQSGLPDRSVAYESVDAIVVTDAAIPNASVAEALRRWVLNGGHLLLSSGDAAALQESDMGKWFAGKLGSGGPLKLRNVDVRELNPLEQLVQNAETLEIRRGVQAVAIGEEGFDGEPLAESLAGTIAAEIPYGFGRVTFVGVDLRKPPMSDWKSLPEFVRRLLLGRRKANAEEDDRSSLAHSGITELASQVYVVQERFPAVRRASTWTILGVLLVYLVVIGPVDYWFVNHVLKRPGATWLTLPIWILAAGAIALVAADRTNGREARLNQTDVLDVDAATGTMRGRTWTTLYSPETQRYAVSASAAEINQVKPDGGTRLSWSAVPENGFGGLYRTSGFDLAHPTYRQSADATTLENVPLQIWSTKTFESSWRGNVKSGFVTSDLSSLGRSRLAGTFSHALPEAVEDWFLVYQNRAYFPADQRPLPPGRQWPGNGSWRQARQRELNGYLTQVVAVRQRDEEGNQSSLTRTRSDYNPLAAGHVAPMYEIMRTISFHEAAAGRDYTGLDNHTLADLELSELLSLNRAVLFGRMKTPVSRITVKDHEVQSEHAGTFVRIVLPVARGKKGDDSIPKLLEDARPE